MNEWSEEQRVALLSVLERAVVELRRINDLAIEKQRKTTRTYGLIYEDGSWSNTTRVFSAEEREEFERVQGERPENERWRLVGIPERVEDR